MLLLKRRNVELARDVILHVHLRRGDRQPDGRALDGRGALRRARPGVRAGRGRLGDEGLLQRGRRLRDQRRRKARRADQDGRPRRAGPRLAALGRRRPPTAWCAPRTRCSAQPPEDRECPPVAEFIKRLGGATLRAGDRRLSGHQTPAPRHRGLTMLSGGYKINVIPEQAEMSFDCRLLPDTDERAFISNLEQLINDPGVQLEVTWPDAPPVDRRLGQRRCSARSRPPVADYAPNAMVAPSICVGGTDARYFRQRGVPVVRPGAVPVRRRRPEGLPRRQRAAVAGQPAPGHADRLRHHAAGRRALSSSRHHAAVAAR